MIIDGASMDMGAVGCLRRVRSAISVARAVMEHTSQSILVGEKATAFATMAGFAEEGLETDRSNELHTSWRANNCQPNYFRDFPASNFSCPPYHWPGARESTEEEVRPRKRGSHKQRGRRRAGAGPRGIVEMQRRREGEVNKEISKENHDTIGMVALDKFGNLAAGTSTNGASHKVAGRVGDAAIPGAGAYVDNDIGAAAATGDGDIMMRFLPSFQAVNYMREGLSPTAACEKALSLVAEKFPSFQGGLICVAKDGRHGAAARGWLFHYSFQDPSLSSPQVVAVPPGKGGRDGIVPPPVE
jgi:N4-(beta-N-acetylglucosaminyl)-L-asparaginase